MNKLFLLCNKHWITEHFKSGIKKPVYKCKKCDYISARKYLKGIKQKCVDYKGGKCEICGYNKCLRSLDFHHKNPNEKDFDIGSSTYGKKIVRNWDRLKPELDKCMLLCKNCHGEIHQKIYDNQPNEKLNPDFGLYRHELYKINKEIREGLLSLDQAIDEANNVLKNRGKKSKLLPQEIKHLKWELKNKI